ncbi:MAG: uroporphyrinogen decarboxylase family protein, partial [Candidatus Bipolaricaulia bacterium]
GPMLEDPDGIRDEETWMKAHHTHPDYIKEIFDMQTEIALENLKLYRQAVGERIEAIGVSATDFGGQKDLLYSPEIYREFYKPFHKKVNNWIHDNTNWKTFFHTDGNVVKLLDDFVEVGVDILNPVQFTAEDMDLSFLKNEYGEELVFWGGGADPQKTLPFGSPKQVREETRENVNILSEGGGFVCSSVHNIQGPTPVENIQAFFNSIREG